LSILKSEKALLLNDVDAQHGKNKWVLNYNNCLKWMIV
jgi:hypothetical protein